MSLFSPLPSRTDAPQAAMEQLETMLVQRLVSSAHLFGGKQAAGSSLHADLFAEALAEAVVKQSGGLGISQMLQPREIGDIGLKSSLVRVETGIEGP